MTLRITWQELFKVFNILPSLSIPSEDAWSQQGWNLSFRRLLNGWEIERVVDMLNRIEGYHGVSNSDDYLVWNGNNNRSSESALHIIICQILITLVWCGLGNLSGKSKLHSKCSVSLGCCLGKHV